VDTFNGVLFGLSDGRRQLRGLGNSIMPRNLEHTQFDEVHWLDGTTGFGATPLLHQRHAVFGGPHLRQVEQERHWAMLRWQQRTLEAMMRLSG
jgi:cysteine synthase A